VDLAVLCAASSSNVKDTPDSLLKVLKPRAVIAAHWESFFRSQSLPPEVGRGTDLTTLEVSLRRSLPLGSRWVVPLPQTKFRFAPAE
jgi:hypothetical protein